jgi:hypothetical protein
MTDLLNRRLNPNLATEKCIAAWTATDGYKFYPQFINISLMQDGRCRLLLRGTERDDGGSPLLSMFISKDAARQLFTDALRDIDTP